MPTDKHGEGNHHILATVCCQSGKILTTVGNVSCDQATRSYNHVYPNSPAVIRQTVSHELHVGSMIEQCTSTWNAHRLEVRNGWSFISKPPTEPPFYKTPVALRQRSKRTKTRIAKIYCWTQCITLHNDRFATSQHISLLKFSSHLCQRPLFSSSFEVYNPNFVGISRLSILHAIPPSLKTTKNKM